MFQVRRLPNAGTAVLTATLVVVMLALPALLNSYYLTLAVSAGLWAYLSLCWNLSGGYAGLFSFGHTAFFAAGAYTSTLLYTELAVSPWLGMFAGAGMNMDLTVSLAASSSNAMSMSGTAAGPLWSTGQFALTLTMWWVMMVAMMLPSAAPTILLYGKATSNAAIRPQTESFLAGYILIWGGFSLLATALQSLLVQFELLARMAMASKSWMLSSAILILAGLYQLSPLKQTCLRHCRSPAHFISRHFRPGNVGALRMGILHGAYCVGCCWLLMALLFVGGAMNLAWIAFLTLLVAMEKLLPFGAHIGRVAGAGLIAWGLVILVG